MRSDAVRKEMLHAPDGRSAPLSYDREARARVYEAARERVRTHLEAGRAVVFDATHLELRQRDAARALASRSQVPALLIWVGAPEDVVKARLVARDTSPDRISDARWETYLAQRERMDALTEYERRDFVELDGSESATTNLARVRARL